LVIEIPLTMEAEDKLTVDVTIQVTGEVALESWESELVTYMDGLSTELSERQKTLLNNFILALKSGLSITNLSDAFDVMYILAGETEESSKRNLISRAFDAEGYNNPAFTAFEGFNFNNTNYLNFIYNPASDSNKFTATNCSLGIYIRNGLISTEYLLFSFDGTSRAAIIDPTGIRNNRVYLNTLTNYVTVALTSAIGMTITSRNATLFRNYCNWNYNSVVAASVNALPNSNLRSTSRAIQLSFVFAGKDFNQTEMNIITDAFEAYMDANEEGVIAERVGDAIIFDSTYESDDLLYKYSTKQLFYQRDDLIFTFNNNGLIFYSEDGGVTFPHSYTFADAHNIQMCHVFANGTILFATRTKIYYSTDKLVTVTEYIVKDTDGSNYLPHTPVNSDYPGSYFSMVQSFPSFTLPDGRELLIWGNYANSILQNGASPANVYYSIDGGCPKIAYKFGINPSYLDNGSAFGGVTGNNLGDPLNPLYTRHVHSITYNSDLDEYYMCTGDKANENHWLKGVYNAILDSWTWTNIIINQSSASRWKTGCLWYHTDGYIYFVSDSTEAPYDYGLFKVLPANIGNSVDCITLEVFDQTASAFRIDGNNLVGRSAVEGDFIFYSKDLINISKLTLTKPDINRDVIVGIMNDKNSDGYYKFNVTPTTDLINYVNNVAVLIKLK